jgi:hypothetical protein
VIVHGGEIEEESRAHGVAERSRSRGVRERRRPPGEEESRAHGLTNELSDEFDQAHMTVGYD